MSAKILPVIHARKSEEAVANAELAMRLGCDGVFFISHGSLKTSDIFDIATMFNLHNSLGPKMPFDYLVGVNMLGEKVIDIMEQASSTVGAVWSDYTPEGEERQQIEDKRKELLGSFELYGGVAFKYQPQPADLVKAAQDVKGFVDVLTTSGAGTGYAPELEKLALLAEGFGKKIAVASGVTPENAASMLPYVDHFLVATGIGKDFYNIDEEKCKALVGAVRSVE